MRTLVSADHPSLRATAQEVPLADITESRVQSLIADMRTLLEETTYGVALAAPQVGESLRIFVVRGAALTGEAEEEERETLASSAPSAVYINPTVTKRSRTKRNQHEGCLSLPNLWGIVPRAEKVTIEAYDENGEKFTRGASGLLAHIFQHEIDHLDGVLYTDRAQEIWEDETTSVQLNNE